MKLNDAVKLTPKIIDFERAIEELKIPGLYRFYRTSLEIGREARLLETIRGQGEMDKNRLYDFSSQFGFSPDYIEAILIPKFVDWDFISNSHENIDINIGSQRDILSKCGKEWQIKNKDPRDLIAIKTISALSRRPVEEEDLQNILKEFDNTEIEDSILTLEAINQTSTLNVGDQKIYFSPTMVGENTESIKKLFSQTQKGTLQVADTIYENISECQGYPQIGLTETAINSEITPNLIESLELCGILDPCKVSIGGYEQTFLFTGDVFKGGDDAYHFIKETVSHFRFAEKFAKQKLLWLPKFLNKLIEKGEAGSAAPIGTDYKLLERNGIIEVKPFGVSGKYRMYLNPGKEDVLMKTLDLIETNVKPIIPLKQNLSIKQQLERISVPPEARTNFNVINTEKTNQLIGRFMELLRRSG